MEAQTKTCQNCEKEFIIEAEDFGFYSKIGVPAPTFCPECRNVQRLATRNVKSLYKRPCDNCGISVISRLSITNPARMFCNKCWWSEDWDPLSYGMDYDFSKSFFEQFHSLLFSVPQSATLNFNMVDSDYSNMESDDKGCYLTFGGHWNEFCAFSEYSIHGREVYDSYWTFYGEQCYDGMNLERCYQTMYSRECKDCINTLFSYDCRGCSEIIGCAGLRHKSHCIFNQQYTKEEYFIEKAKLNLGSRDVIKDLIQKSHKVWLNSPHLFMIGNQVVNCTGNYIFNSKNAHNVWQAEAVENVKNLYIAAWSKDCHDETSAAGNELGYMNSHGGGLYNCKAVLYSFQSDFNKNKHTHNSEYSYNLLGSSDCFGCVGVRKKKYCILNKQYTKEEYEELLKRIKEQMKEQPFISPSSGFVFSYGDFFPNEHSLFAYNETVANDFYPLTKDLAEQKGFVWREDTVSEYSFDNYNVPDGIQDVKDDILKVVLKCEDSGKAYRIIEQELTFYKKMNISIPVVAPLQRIKNRINELLPFKLWHRQCMCDKTNHFHGEGKCDVEFETAYAHERPEIIYCEKCYQAEVL